MRMTLQQLLSRDGHAAQRYREVEAELASLPKSQIFVKDDHPYEEAKSWIPNPNLDFLLRRALHECWHPTLSKFLEANPDFKVPRFAPIWPEIESSGINHQALIGSLSDQQARQFVALAALSYGLEDEAEGGGYGDNGGWGKAD